MTPRKLQKAYGNFANSIETCPDGHYCLNGSNCKIANKYEENRYTCDCAVASASNTGKFYAGRNCEFQTDLSSLCQDFPADADYSGYNLSFCVNGGECKGFVSTEKEILHVGCRCPADNKYFGDRCQYVQNTWTSPHHKTSKMEWLVHAFVGLLIAFVTLAGILIIVRGMRYRRKKRLDAVRMKYSKNGESSMPTAESIRAQLMKNGEDNYPLNHSKLLRTLAKNYSDDNGGASPDNNSKRSNGHNVIRFDDSPYGHHNGKSYRDNEYSSGSVLNRNFRKNHIEFDGTPHDEVEDFEVRLS